MAVYGTALWTGGWLGVSAHPVPIDALPDFHFDDYPTVEQTRKAFGLGVGALGLALVAVAAWPRRTRLF